MATLYLDQLRDVSGSNALAISESTAVLCEAALIDSFYRSNWRQDLEELSDSEWNEAKAFVETAIAELNGTGGEIDGGGP